MREPEPIFGVSKAGLAAPALVLIALLGGCSGSGSAPPPTGGGGPPPPPPPPPPPGANGSTGDAYWLGVTRDQDGEFLQYANCLLVEAGELACWLSGLADDGEIGPPVAALHGNVQFLNTPQVGGSGRMYALPGQVLPDGSSVVADLTITGGALTEMNTRMKLTYTSLGEEITFHGEFYPLYVTLEDGVSWDPVGVYTGFDIHGEQSSLTIDEDGTLFLQTESGCSGNGQLINIEPQQISVTQIYNAFTVDVTIANCQELNGVYAGLATRYGHEFGYYGLVIALYSDSNAIIDGTLK